MEFLYEYSLNSFDRTQYLPFVPDMSLVKISDFAIRVPKEYWTGTLKPLDGGRVGRLKGYAFSFGKSQH